MTLLLCLLMIGLLFAGILSGFPVMFVLLATGFFVAGIGATFGSFDLSLLGAVAPRIYALFDNQLLYAVPLFIFLGKLMEHSKLVEQLFNAMLARGLGNRGIVLLVMSFSVVLAASSGLVGASILMLTSIALVPLRTSGLSDRFAAGLICGSGTLGQIIPPSIVLILLADQISNANQVTQLAEGNFAPDPVTVGHVFAGALLPGLLLAAFFVVYGLAKSEPKAIPSNRNVRSQGHDGSIWQGLFAVGSLLLVPLVIVFGVASPTEAASFGIFGVCFAILLSKPSVEPFRLAAAQSVELIGMIVGIIIGATVFALVFRGIGGDQLIADLLPTQNEGQIVAVSVVLAGIFVLGFVLEFIEITYLVVPIAAPILLSLDVDPIWLAVMIAMVLQTSFLTPPMGVSLFYFRAASNLPIAKIYRSVWPYIAMQLGMLIVLAVFPKLATWLPNLIFN